MIQNIDPKTLRNSEFQQFLTDLIALIDAYEDGALDIHQEYEALNAAREDTKTVFVKETVAERTKELAALDNLRDDLVNGLIILVRGYAYSPVAEIKKSSRLLEAHIQSYGTGIARENYQSETFLLSQLVKGLTEKQELVQAAEMLHLTEWIQQLQQANEDFSDKYVARSMEQGTITEESFTQRRVAATEAFYKLRDRLGALYTLHHGVAPYSNMVNDFNALIDQYKKVVAVRQGRKPPPANEAGA
jgi:hypothetical protein